MEMSSSDESAYYMPVVKEQHKKPATNKAAVKQGKEQQPSPKTQLAQLKGKKNKTKRKKIRKLLKAERLAKLDPKTLTKKEKKLVKAYQKNNPEGTTRQRQELLESARMDAPLNDNPKVMIDLSVMDNDSKAQERKENVIDLLDDDKDHEEEKDDYGDLYFDAENIKLPPKKRKRVENKNENASLVEVVPPSEDTITAVAADNNDSSAMISTRDQVMKALVQAKQELQGAQQLATAADRKQVIRQTKVKLKEAQLKFQALRQQEQQQLVPPPPPLPVLPPITALQQLDNLVITNLNEGPDKLVRYHNRDDNDDEFDCIRQQATEMAFAPHPHQDETPAMIKLERLQYLKDKLSKLKSKQSQQSKKPAGVSEEERVANDGVVQPGDDEEEDADDSASLFDEPEEEATSCSTDLDCDVNTSSKEDVPPIPSKKVKQSKEDLMKRQGELQAQMDIAYWKKLVAKQKKLLEEQQSKAQQIEVELQECEQGINHESKGLRECDDAIARWPILDDMIVNTTRQVLNTRKALREARNGDQDGAAE